MVVLECWVCKHTLQTTSKTFITTKSQNIDEAHFDFSVDWNTMTSKTANFYLEGECVPISVLINSATNTCLIPNEVLSSYAPQFYLSVLGVNTTQRITTNKVKVPLEKGAYCASVPPIGGGGGAGIIAGGLTNQILTKNSDIDGDYSWQTWSFTHVQGTASTTWNINHDLKSYPHVTLLDSAGTEFEAHVNHPDIDNTVIISNIPISGTALLTRIRGV